MRADNAVGRAGTFESFRLGMSEKFYVQSLRFRASRSGGAVDVRSREGEGGAMSAEACPHWGGQRVIGVGSRSLG